MVWHHRQQSAFASAITLQLIVLSIVLYDQIDIDHAVSIRCAILQCTLNDTTCGIKH